MRSLMRVSSVEIAASPLVVVPPTRKRRRTWEASTVAPAPPTCGGAGWLATDPARETRPGGDYRFAATPLPSIVDMAGYQCEHPVDTGRRPTTPRLPPTGAGPGTPRAS